MNHKIEEKEKNKNLSEAQRHSIVHALLLRSKNEKPLRGAIKEVAELFKVNRMTVSILCKDYLLVMSSKLSKAR